MVTIDLDVKAVVGLADSRNIKEKDLGNYLEKFEKKDLIRYIVSEVFDEEDQEKNLDEEDY